MEVGNLSVIEGNSVLTFEDGDGSKVEERDGLEPSVSVSDDSGNVENWEGVFPRDAGGKEVGRGGRRVVK